MLILVRRIFLLSVFFLSSPLFFCHTAEAALFPSPSSHTKFAPVDQAFAFDFKQEENGKVLLQWKILPGYYLYQHKLSVAPENAMLSAFSLPEGASHRDEFFGEVQIYTDQLSVALSLEQVSSGGELAITYQGCAEAGFCYPPETRVIPLNEFHSKREPLQDKPSADNSQLASIKQPFSPLWAVLIGLGIAFTPCVLPMYPLISSLIFGRQRPDSLKRIFWLALLYVQGMALTYTFMGILVARAGLQFQAMLQHPYILIFLSIIFVFFAFSMFGFYTLQLPSRVQTALVNWSNKRCGGGSIGVFMMGAVAGLICSPCTTAPLGAILLYIAQSGNALQGGVTLYLYALGMGIPLIMVALFGNHVLPRSGPWMQAVKEGFGFVILTLPAVLLGRVLGDVWETRMLSLLSVVFLGWAFLLSLKSTHNRMRIVQVLLFSAAMIATRPLQDWIFTSTTVAATEQPLLFKPIRSRSELEQTLLRSKGKKVMLDLYADWCVACKQFDKYTFNDSEVRKKLSTMQLARVDVTENNSADRELYKQYQVLGLPTILFFDEQGNELREERISGFLDAKAFLQHIERMIDK